MGAEIGQHCGGFTLQTSLAERLMLMAGIQCRVIAIAGYGRNQNCIDVLLHYEDEGPGAREMWSVGRPQSTVRPFVPFHIWHVMAIVDSDIPTIVLDKTGWY